jgi:hypothetical protein
MSISFLANNGKDKLKVSKWSIEKNSPGQAVIGVCSENPGRLLAIFTMEKDSDYLKIQPGRESGRLRLDLESHISALPDLLAEDYIYFPGEIKNEARVPSDSLCLLNLTGNGDSMVVWLWTGNDTKVRLGKNSLDSGTIDYNTIECLKNKHLLLGILRAPGIWCQIKDKLPSDSFKKIDWAPPFSSNWRMTLRMESGVIPVSDGCFDSWEIPEKTKDGKSSAPRFGVAIRNQTSWEAGGSPYRGWIYPCFTDNGALFARTPVFQVAGFAGDSEWKNRRKVVCSETSPPVIYTYITGKTPETSFPKKGQPLPAYDKLTETLRAPWAVGLVSSPSPDDRYPATCSVTEDILRFFKDDKDKENEASIITQLDRMDMFVEMKNKRVNEFIDWADLNTDRIRKAAEGNSGLQPFAEKLINYLALIRAANSKAADSVKTPADTFALSARYALLINDKKLSAEQKEREADIIGREIRKMNGQRDNLTAHMRLIVKSIRCHLAQTLASGLTPEEEELAVSLRRECGDILRFKHGHEGK